MSFNQNNLNAIDLPALPVKHEDWIDHVSAHPGISMSELIAPYKEYDSKLREIFAQQPHHPAITKPNIVPVFAGKERDLKVRARDIAAESDDERQRFLMPLKQADRKPNGVPAVVQTIKEFQTNFQLFSESSLVDMDWSNVVVAGSAVVTSLLPVPAEHNSSKRALREYYHRKLAPASDVDLFLYGLTEEQAIGKIKQIEQRIRDSILTETTTVRTKNAITIVSQYPTRHVQIVLRIYRSISEILTGFDVDCSCAAYDGKQVYASPRALAAYMTQINTIDLTRRSPSYENRLSKYSRRGFEVYWPLLERSRIDPTLFERSFGRTLGLARLLVLEKLPKNTDREAYVDQRRAERGRPTINRWGSRKLKGNMKDEHDDEVAEWVETDEVSDYHTYTIPYGPKYHARKIERLLYAKDLLLNAEWNVPKDREVVLHRHPAFFGYADDVVGDCCGHCPKPTTHKEQEIAIEESTIYVSGNLTFIKDDPGRQAIGSFNPLTDDDWTEMAYVGNTARLCQAIVDGDIEHVQDWLSQEGADPNRRDYTGRTPLHLAVSSSTPEIVQCLIDAGARITARIFDGKTALHLAAMRGETAMVTALLTRSEANEEMEAEKEISRKSAQETTREEDQEMVDINEGTRSTRFNNDDNVSDVENGSDDDEMDMVDDASDNIDATTENSIIKIDRLQPQDHDNLPEDDNEEEPDVLDINVLAWDAPVSALHLAIANGHVEVVRVLVQDFGADILLPIKLLHYHNKSARAAILPLVLALQLPLETAKDMTKMLMSLGASPAQADMEHITALHYFAAHGDELLSTMVSIDRPAAQRAVHHLSISDSRYSLKVKSTIQTAIEHGDVAAVDALMELGGKPQIDFATYITSYKSKWDPTGPAENNQKTFQQNFQQPIFTAVQCELPSMVLKLLDAGADVNSLTTGGWYAVHQHESYEDQAHTLLDAVRAKKAALHAFINQEKKEDTYNYLRYPPVPLKDDTEYLQGYDPGSYAYWSVAKQVQQAKLDYKNNLKNHEEWKTSQKDPEGTAEKKNAVRSLLADFEELEFQLIKRDAKTFKDLYPNIRLSERRPYNYRRYEPKPPEAWSPRLTFQLPDLTDTQCAGYKKLFQACWDADLSTIKELTLAIWADSQSPLKIAVKDSYGFSTYAIAVLRNHFDIAKAILEISHAQYAPKERTGQSKHSLQPADDDSEYDDSTTDRQDDFQIYTEIVDDRFTIENIGEVQNKVKSNETPLQMISWPCPVTQFLEGEVDTAFRPAGPNSNSSLGGHYPYRRYGGTPRGGHAPRKLLKDAANGRTYHVSSAPVREQIAEVQRPGNLMQLAIFLDDQDLLHFLIAMGEDYTVRKKSDTSDDKPSTFFSFDEQDFQYAIRLGRVQLLQEITKRTGAGIPLDHLAKRSGIETTEKPKYYQGLSVHGRKRADWANAGRDTQCEPIYEQHPPLLLAARLGSLGSVEWFSSEASLRCYSEFASNHRDDERIQNLAKTKDGLDESISGWLGLRSHLLLHCVVLSTSSEQAQQLLRHLCTTRPKAIEHRSSSGLTPLQLAFSLHRTEMIKILIEAGADQTCRNNVGDNILHSMLSKAHTLDVTKDLPRYRELLGLVDKRLLASLFTERTTAEPGAATPLARWLYLHVKRVLNHEGHEQYVKAFIEHSNGEDLGLVNGEGDTPVHAAVRYRAQAVLRVMLECRPELLHRENATGRTPYEMAENAYLSEEVFSNPPSLDTSRSNYGNRRGRYLHAQRLHTVSVLDKQPEEFVVNRGKEEGAGTESVWQVCKEFAARSKGTKRKLVTLVEANEVAKRLALRNGSRVDPWCPRDEDDDAHLKKQMEETNGDEVDAWYSA